MANPNSPSSPRGRAASLFKRPADAWEERTQMVKREVEAERIATEKKTARLRALRLEKEAAEREAAPAAPVAEVKRRGRKTSPAS